MGEQQRLSLFEFIDSLTLLLSETQATHELAEVERKLHYSMALLERDFPMTLQVSIHGSQEGEGYLLLVI